tara:strand:- start:471 stop:596 length:126 start_codon:yes stop_codon:yes gene_type:complete
MNDIYGKKNCTELANLNGICQRGIFFKSTSRGCGIFFFKSS